MNYQPSKPVNNSVNNITNKANAHCSNKKNRKRRRKNRKQGQSTSSSKSNPGSNDQNNMCTSQEIEMKEACDVVNDKIISTRTVTVIENVTRRPNSFKALDPKRCSGSEYEEFNTPSCEYNPIVPKVDEDTANINKQWEDLCDFDGDNKNILDDLDKLSVDEAKSIEHDDIQELNKSIKYDDEDDDAAYESTHEFIPTAESEYCVRHAISEYQSTETNEPDLHTEKDDNDDPTEIKIEHSCADPKESSEYTENNVLNDQDVKRFLDIECIEDDEVVTKVEDQFSVKTNDSVSTKSEIIFTEDGFVDDIIEYKGYQTLELPTNRTTEKSMKVMILGPNGSLKPLSETSITNVTSISCESNIKSTSKTNKSSKNPLKKIWKRFKKNKSRSKNEADIEELDDGKLSNLIPAEEEVDVKSQDNQNVTEECCLSISTKSEVKEIDSNQALNSYRLSLVPSVDPLTQSMNNTDGSDTEIIEQSEANHELPVKNVRIDCKFIVKKEIVVGNESKSFKNEEVGVKPTNVILENGDSSMDNIVLQSDPSELILLSVEPCKIDQKIQSTEEPCDNKSNDYIKEKPIKVNEEEKKEDEHIKETEPAEQLKLEAPICKIDYNFQIKFKTLSLPIRNCTTMKLTPAIQKSKDDAEIVPEKVSEISTAVPKINESIKEDDDESVKQMEPFEQSRIEIQLYKIDCDTEPSTNTINIVECKQKGKSEPVQVINAEAAFIEFDRMLNEFEKPDNHSSRSHSITVENDKVKLSSSTIQQTSNLIHEDDNEFDPDNVSTTLSSVAYLNDDHLFPDAITPTKVIEFIPLDSYDVPYIDDWRFDKTPELSWGETLRKHSSSNYQTYSLLNTKAPIASLESLLFTDPSSDQPSKSSTVKKVAPPSMSLRAKKSFTNFIKGSGRTR